MTVLLEIKERLKLVYSKCEIILLPLAKFLLAFVTLNTLNGKMGYMTQLDNIAVVLMVALLCSFMPMGVLVFFATLISLLHMYALSMEVALVGLCVYLVLYLLFFRLSPKDSLVVVLTPLLCAMKIPYVVPIVVGLLYGPASVVSAGCGIIVYHFLQVVIGNASNIRTMGSDEALAKVRLTIESMMGNKEMVVMIAAFAVTILIVYVIRRMSINYSWTIAIIAGAMVEVVCLLIGDLFFDINLAVGSVLLGAVLGIAAGMVVEFFRFCVDYSRIEKVQFEDDEYYYYVKAIPKMTIHPSTKTVKKINSQQMREEEMEIRGASSRQAGRTRQGQTSRSGQANRREQASRLGQSAGMSSGRSVVTERMVPKGDMGAGRMASGRNGYQTTSHPEGRGNGNGTRTQRTTRARVNVENTRDLLDEFEEE